MFVLVRNASTNLSVFIILIFAIFLSRRVFFFASAFDYFDPDCLMLEVK